MATLLGTSGQLGDLELRVQIPDARVVDGEDGKVLRLQRVDVRLICDSERAALDVVETGSMNGRGLRSGACEVATKSNVAATEEVRV